MTEDGERRLGDKVEQVKKEVEHLVEKIDTLDTVTRARFSEMAQERKKDREELATWRRKLLRQIRSRLTGQVQTIEALKKRVGRFRSIFLKNKQTAMIAGAVAAVVIGVFILLVRPEILPAAIQAIRGK